MSDQSSGLERSTASASPPVLASDAEREAVVTLLNEACTEGRLTLEEFSERLDAAYAARTRDELASLTEDLPTTPDATRMAPYRGAGKRRRWLLGIVGDAGRAGSWSADEELTAVAALGDVTIDLRGARVTSDELTITAFAVLGDVKIIAPEGVDVELSGMAILGDSKNTLPHSPWGPSRLVVKVQGYALLGDVKVQPPKKPGERGRLRRTLGI